MTLVDAEGNALGAPAAGRRRCAAAGVAHQAVLRPLAPRGRLGPCERASVDDADGPARRRPRRPARARQGEPFLPGPVFAAPYHLAGDADAAPYGYGRDDNPTWARYEAALGELEDGEAVVFASGMAAVSAVLLPAAAARATCWSRRSDGYPGVRAHRRASTSRPAAWRSALVPTDDDACARRCPARRWCGSRRRRTRGSTCSTSRPRRAPRTRPGALRRGRQHAGDAAAPAPARPRRRPARWRARRRR